MFVPCRDFVAGRALIPRDTHPRLEPQPPSSFVRSFAPLSYGPLPIAFVVLATFPRTLPYFIWTILLSFLCYGPVVPCFNDLLPMNYMKHSYCKITACNPLCRSLAYSPMPCTRVPQN